ncbi:radical SAM protein [Heliorestis convoluta]|uniref:Radical SAM protein n=1 Tax=Heliorestis convoluta TaxID=356322 RepID=A0A5Q2N189_9FIRM|nr:radical SAM protein [Heliorestis convoluta]QGG48121.1 radical SAM protein [Heliorestis convoluta]
MIIPIFLPQIGCPSRCIYCNQEDLTGSCGLPEKESINQTIEAYLSSQKDKEKKADRVEIAFYGGTFTALPVTIQEQLLSIAAGWIAKKEVHQIRLSTRPDHLDRTTICRLQAYGVKTVEVGAQTMNPTVLKKIHRGHEPKDTVRAMKLLKQEGLQTSLHIMTALPGDDEASALLSLEECLHLQPDFLRIHPTLVLKNSLLEKEWREGRYQPWSWGRNLRLLTKMALLCARYQKPVHRWGLMPGELCQSSYLAGPYSPSLGEWVKRSLAFLYLSSLLTCALESPQLKKQKTVTLAVPSKDLSLVRGQRKWLLRHGSTISHFSLHSICQADLQKNLPTYLPFHGDWYFDDNGEKIFFLTLEEFIANCRI